MNRILFRITIICLSVFLLNSCNKKSEERRFTVEGVVANAGDQMLYLVGSAHNKLDSATLDKEGHFYFTSPAPAQTDFYSLRLGGQIIHFVVDSIETIDITADAHDFSQSYIVTGSPENQKIKALSLLQLNTLIEYRKYQNQFDNKEITADDFVRSASAIIDNYKSNAREYIAAGFSSPAAYFALFQQIDSMMIFDPYNKEDLKLFGALANNYPDSVRREQLKNLYLNGAAVQRREKELDVKEADSSVLFDISLPSTDGKEIALSEAGKGKLTLIEFTVYGATESPAHNMFLADIYNKYKNKGFEIYQISLDPDDHQWLNAAGNIPWIKVRDPESVYSPNLLKFNISSLPSGYLRDKSGEIVERIDDYNTLESLINKHLKR